MYSNRHRPHKCQGLFLLGMPKERKWSPRTRIIYCLPAFCGRLKMKAIIILLLSIILLVVSAERHGRIKPKERISKFRSYLIYFDFLNNYV